MREDTCITKRTIYGRWRSGRISSTCVAIGCWLPSASESGSPWFPPRKFAAASWRMEPHCAWLLHHARRASKYERTSKECLIWRELALSGDFRCLNWRLCPCEGARQWVQNEGESTGFHPQIQLFSGCNLCIVNSKLYSIVNWWSFKRGD